MRSNGHTLGKLPDQSPRRCALGHAYAPHLGSCQICSTGRAVGKTLRSKPDAASHAKKPHASTRPRTDSTEPVGTIGCPICKDAPGRNRIVAETFVSEGSETKLHAQEIDGWCNECIAVLAGKRRLATTLLMVPSLLLMGLTAFDLPGVAFWGLTLYGASLFLQRRYGWADNAAYGDSLETVLLSHFPKRAPGARLRFPLDAQQASRRLKMVLVVLICAQVGTLVMLQLSRHRSAQMELARIAAQEAAVAAASAPTVDVVPPTVDVAPATVNSAPETAERTPDPASVAPSDVPVIARPVMPKPTEAAPPLSAQQAMTELLKSVQTVFVTRRASPENRSLRVTVLYLWQELVPTGEKASPMAPTKAFAQVLRRKDVSRVVLKTHDRDLTVEREEIPELLAKLTSAKQE